jgi:hypothetical protein
MWMPRNMTSSYYKYKGYSTSLVNDLDGAGGGEKFGRAFFESMLIVKKDSRLDWQKDQFGATPIST